MNENYTRIRKRYIYAANASAVASMLLILVSDKIGNLDVFAIPTAIPLGVFAFGTYWHILGELSYKFTNWLEHGVFDF